MEAPTDASSLCSICGQPDAEMDPWLGVCLACLAAAGESACSEETPPPDLPSIPGYRLRRLVGRGGMGWVYEAEREADGQRVAVKRICPEIAGDGRFLKQFQREGEALRRLDHPGVVRRFGSGDEGGLPWLAMEFVDGPDLRQVLRLGPLPVARALEIAAEAAAALGEAHGAGILHRDVKPANLLLDPSGRVKVADFGMARPHPAPETVSGRRQATHDSLSLAPGAGLYSAPELERGSPGDARADIYALGAVLYHLLAGHAPRANCRPARKERPGAGISARLDRIVTRCLETNPARRFASMADLGAALEAERRRLAEPRGRRLRWVPVAGAALAVGIVTGLGLRDATRPDPEEAARRLLEERLSPSPPEWNPRRAVNSLGMSFVEIPDCEVLFCEWETRVADYAAFAGGHPGPDDGWARESRFAFPLEAPVYSLRSGEFRAGGDDWRFPGFPNEPDHAVCGVSASDAMAFCTWLTWKERREGRIRSDQGYRLPTDAEWSAAAGLAPEPGETPEERAASWPQGLHAYPWGGDWPVPDEVYNVAGDEVDGWEHWHPGWRHGRRNDPWRGTAPVASGVPSALGLHHLTGNVWEWTETPFNQGEERHALVLRGGSWHDASREGLCLGFRDRDVATVRMTKRGFRVVFEESGAEGWRYGESR
jgi:serine/threonine protein kinase/formylglycine-generating enzyme required for sulfatase activity